MSDDPREAPMLTSAPHRLRWAALAVLLVAEAMVLLDTTIVAVAAPVVHAALPGPSSDVQWFSAAFTLPFAALLVTGGRLGDRFGRRRMFRAGIAAFVLASSVCAAAGSAPVLIGARAVQGVAAALVVPQTIGLIKALFDGPELGRALGTIGPVMGLTAICGPVLGGLLTHVPGLSWRAVFLVNVPLGVAVLAGAALVREDRAPGPVGIDVPGTVLVAAASAALVVPLVTARWSVAEVGTLLVGVLLAAAFAVRQRRVAGRGGRPLVEPSLFAGPGFGAALVTSTLFFAVLTGVTVVVPLAAQYGPGAGDALGAGLTLVPWAAASAVASLVGGRYLLARLGAAAMPAGLVAVVVGLAAAAVVWTDGAGPRVAAALGIAGAGCGLFTVAFFTTALHRVRPHETGSAAGLLNAFQQFGASLGTAVLGGVYVAGAGPSGLRHALVLAVVLVVVAAVPARVLARATPDRGEVPGGSGGTSPSASG